MKIAKICILGGGTAGWMTAAGLAQKFANSNVEITLVESEQIGTVGVGEATLPHIRFFNNALGIHEPSFMKATNATFKMGIEFRDWGKLGDSYIHPFGDFGQPINSVPFYHYWNKLRLLGDTTKLDSYSYPIVASENARFQLPDEDISKIESTFGYAYQFDSSLYAKFLKTHAEQNGVRRIEGRVENVSSNAETGFVEKLHLESSEVLEADLFIDCSGFRGLLIEQTLETGYEDWSEWLPCNRAIAVPSTSAGKLLPYTRATAKKAGWQWRIPLQHRTGNGVVYWNDHISDDEACHELMSSIEGEALAEPNQLYFKTGKRRLLWNKNVVAIGLSAGFMEPLESTSIYLIQEGITALLELFPSLEFPDSDIDEYNARMDLHFERVRDFLLLHYVATERDDSEMWRYFRNMALPDSLQDKINAWTVRGHIIRYEFGAFLPPSWVAVMAGQNLLPQKYDVRVDKLAQADLKQQARDLEASISRAVENTPDHKDFIAQYGAAIPDMSEAG
ncbi:MAG: tryptophan 7-halogenase [Hyphomonadaceae bacterium]|nr:tryptophan 7-halogenase [Hyphomonadaceae bacterium]